MLSQTQFIVWRLIFDDPGFNLHIEASNGRYSGGTDIYCNVSELAELGQAFRSMPYVYGTEAVFERGSEDHSQRPYRYFLIRAQVTSGRGGCTLQIAMNQMEEQPDDGACRFSIQCELSSLHALGQSLLELADRQGGELQWVPDAELTT